MIETIKTLLQKAVEPTYLDVVDQSHRHRNHPEAKKHGGGHFDVCISSPQFKGQTPIQRHQAVYRVLGGLLQGGQIHALCIDAYTPEEWAQKRAKLKANP